MDSKSIVDLGCFTSEDQVGFARLSGDYNPIHLSQAFARKTFLGTIIVHGMHLVDRLLARCGGGQYSLKSLKVSFLKPARLDENLEAYVETKGAFYKASIRRVSTQATLVQLQWEYSKEKRDCVQSNFKSVGPRIRENIVEGDCGTLNLDGDLKAEQAEPISTDRQILRRLSAMVGMEIPGRDSLFVSLQCFRVDDRCDNLRFSVENFDRRFGLVKLKFEADGMKGIAEGFLRFPQVVPEREISPKFLVSEKRCLIVGGSRGLGAATAKILARSGAKIMVTYHSGNLEADLVLDSLFGDGHTSVAFDALEETALCDEIVQWKPNLLFYFATPFIFAGDGGRFRSDLFEIFSKFYVGSFARLVEQLLHSENSLEAVWQPSTSSLTEFELDLAEYAAAKSASESMFVYLREKYPKVTFDCTRLTRTLTDQTASIADSSSFDPFDQVYEWLSGGKYFRNLSS